MSIRLKIALLGLLAGIVIVLSLVLGKRFGSKQLMVSAVEAYHTAAITDAMAKADALSKSADADQAKLKALQDEIAARKDKLSQTYTDAGMSANEIADRLASLHL